MVTSLASELALVSTLELARLDDIDAVAALLVQLFTAELPGALRGPEASQRALLRYILAAEGGAALRGRHLVRDAAGTIFGTFALRLPDEPPTNFAPRGMVSRCVALFGPFTTTRMLGTLARTLFTPAPALPPDGAHLHGLVVDTHQRCRGLGAAIMREAEGLARSLGRRVIHLQIVADNHAARRFYARLGYEMVSRPQRRLGPLTFAVEPMAKVLGPTG